MQTHHADCSTIVDEDMVWHGVVDGDHLDQWLVSKLCYRHHMASVHSDWRYIWHCLSRRRAGSRRSLSIEPSVVDGVDVVHQILAPS
jgi:hypothetical protein